MTGEFDIWGTKGRGELLVAAHTFLRSFLLRFQECEKACQLTCFFAFGESDAGDLRIHSPVLPPPPKAPHALSVSSILPQCSNLPDVSKPFSPPAATAALPKPRPPGPQRHFWLR